MKFQKGVSGNPGGNNKHDIVSLDYWLKKIEKSLSDKRIAPAEKVRLQCKIVELLLQRNDFKLPSKPSKSPQKDSLNALDALENNGSGRETGSNSPSVGDRPSPV